MLELSSVSKKYGQVHAVHPVSLKLRAGQTYVLIGPSGCGKSTLLRIMMGLVSPDSGTVHFAGEQMSRENVMAMRHRIGYVIQDGGLFPHLSASGNICLLASYLGWEAQRIERRVRELAELTHFPVDGLDRYPAQLSGGQQQRVSLMRALMLDPDLLLMDEPLGALDPMIRADLQRELAEIFERLHKTVVLVTHDLGEAAFFGDSIALMRGGRVVQQGTFDQLDQSPSDPFVTQFIRAQRFTVKGGDG